MLTKPPGRPEQFDMDNWITYNIEIVYMIWVGVLNLLPSPWRSIAQSPSLRRRGNILFAKASPAFLVEVSIFLMADQIPVLQGFTYYRVLVVTSNHAT